MPDFLVMVFMLLVCQLKTRSPRLQDWYVRDAKLYTQYYFVCLQVLKSDIDTLKSELQSTCEISDTLQKELSYVTSERQSLVARIEELSKELASSNRFQVGLIAHRHDCILYIYI